MKGTTVLVMLLIISSFLAVLHYQAWRRAWSDRDEALAALQQQRPIVESWQERAGDTLCSASELRAANHRADALADSLAACRREAHAMPSIRIFSRGGWVHLDVVTGRDSEDVRFVRFMPLRDNDSSGWAFPSARLLRAERRAR